MRLLCKSTAAREQLSEALRHYRWRDLAHRVIYQFVAGPPQLTEAQLRRVLPTRLTNAGFPDFPWEDLFLPEALSITEADAFLRGPQPPIAP